MSGAAGSVARRALWKQALTNALLALPAALMALGWFYASGREREARTAGDRRALLATVEAVAAAAREGLEELRAREDERPYYLYSYHYTPPDLIAVQESVAVSPLGRVPADPRVRGHFQLDPGARLTSPLEHAEAPTASRQRAGVVLTAARAVVAPRLASLARPPSFPDPTRLGDVNDSASSLSNSVFNQSVYSERVLADIRAAQSGVSEAQLRVARRGRAPSRERVTVPWSAPTRNDLDAEREPSQGATIQVPPSVARTEPGAGRAEYTPMVLARDGATLYAWRVVTTDGGSSVQGVLLDESVVRERWLPSVAARHAVAGVRVEVVPVTETRCRARVALAAPLDDLALCATATRPSAEGSLAWQRWALAGVLGLIVASAAARARALRRAEELAAVERAFVASVSHELRTPLTTLRMHAEMLEEGWVSEARRAKVLRQLVEESGRLSRLIEDVLTFGRLADGRAAITPEEGDLTGHVRALAERERARLEERGVTLELEGLKGPVSARFDPTAVDQVVTNLLDNAAKYAAGAGDRAVSLSVEARGSKAVVRVRDRGPGIPEGEREKVFQRFYRGREALASHVAGTGLGLAIVRGLARAMGGEVRAVDPPGSEGCVIEVELPGG